MHMKAKKDITPQEYREISLSFGKIEIIVSISDIIQIIIAILTLFSCITVILTLSEMQKDRNAAYKPTILMNAVNYQISWDTNSEEEWVSQLPNTSSSSYEVDEDGILTGTLTVPVSIFPNNGLEHFSVVNIGVGTAKDVRFEWDQNNMSYLCNYLAECDSSKSDFCSFDQSAAFSFGKRIVVTDMDSSIGLMYMLSDATETYSLPLPTAYSILIHEIMKYPTLSEPPHIVLYVEYSDVQGKSTRDIFYVIINRTHYESKADNSGNASYQLTPVLLTG